MRESVLSPGVRVEDYATVERSVILDNTVIGANAVIQNAIIDKDVVVPEGRRWVWTKTTTGPAKRVFFIVDNGSSHRGTAAIDRLSARYPNAVMIHTPVHASWLNQVEIYFSIVQRKVLTPNDFPNLAAIEQRLAAFQGLLQPHRRTIPLAIHQRRPPPTPHPPRPPRRMTPDELTGKTTKSSLWSTRTEVLRQVIKVAAL